MCSKKKCSPSWLALAESFDGGVVFGSPAAAASAATADDGLSRHFSEGDVATQLFFGSLGCCLCFHSACFFLCLSAMPSLIRLPHHRVSDLHRVPCRLLLSRVRLELW